MLHEHFYDVDILMQDTDVQGTAQGFAADVRGRRYAAKAM